MTLALVGCQSWEVQLDCEPDYLFGHLANIELDEDNEILMSGING